MWWDHGMGGTVETWRAGPGPGDRRQTWVLWAAAPAAAPSGSSQPHCWPFCVSSHCPGLGLLSMPLSFPAPAPRRACLQRRGFGESSEATQEVGADCQSVSAVSEEMCFICRKQLKGFCNTGDTVLQPLCLVCVTYCSAELLRK